MHIFRTCFDLCLAGVIVGRERVVRILDDVFCLFVFLVSFVLCCGGGQNDRSFLRGLLSA